MNCKTISLLLPLCFVALTSFHFVNGFGTGAPESHCGGRSSMMPGHGIPAATDKIPYYLSTDSRKTTYSTGETISITLAGDRTFTGFLIQAITSNKTVVGKMIAPQGGQSKLLNCGSPGRNGITHTSKRAKSSFTFQWEGPDTDSSGTVTFLVTVVQNYSTYWVRQLLLTLTAVEAELPTTTVQHETDESTDLSPTVTPLAQTTVVSTSASTPLTSTKPIFQVTSNNLLQNSNTRVTRIDIYTAHNGGYNATASHTYDNSFDDNDTVDTSKNMSSDNFVKQNSSSTLSPSTVVYYFNETNQEATTTDVPSLYSKLKVTNNPQIYDNSKYSNNNFQENFLNSKPLYGTTPSVNGGQYQTIRSFDTVDDNRIQQFSTGQYVNVNHRTKARNTEMPTTQRDLPLFDKGFENVEEILPTGSADTTFDNVYTSATTSSVNGFNLNTINTNHKGQTKRLDNWTNSYDQMNSSHGDLYNNNENLSFTDPLGTTHPGLLGSLKDKWSPSLRVTELPLSDPDRIFEVTKQILQKDSRSNDILTFEELIKPLDFTVDNFNNNVNRLNQTTSSFTRTAFDFNVNSAEKSPEKSFSTKPFILETTSVSNTNNTLETTTENYITTVNDNAKSVQKSSEWKMSTTQPSVTIGGGSRSTTLKEIVSKWMREHIHTIPDPVSTVPSNEPGVSKINEEKGSIHNETKSVKHLDSSSPKIEGGKIEYDPQCGVVKGCFVDCSGNDCKFMVTWRDLGSAVQFEMFGKPDRSFTDAWVAVGFSTDTRMGDDSVTECVYSNGFIQAFSSYTTGYSNPKRLNPPKIGLANVEGYYYDGVLFCSFIRQKSIPRVPGFFDLEQDWHIMFAHGKVLQVPAWQLYMHSTTDLPPASAARVDYQSVVVIGSAAKFPLVKAHGCLMIIGWVLFTGIGLVVARYYKSVWGDKTFMKLKIWFQVHRACMVTAVGFNIVAFILIFIEVKGYSEIPDIPGKGYLRSHPVLGIIVTVLCVANPVMALFRPGPDSSRRPIFNWAHWGVGMSAYILSAICICFGFQLGKSSTPDYAIYIMIVYVLYIIIFDVAFEVMELLNKKEKKVKVEGMEMSNRNGTENGTIPNGNHMTKDKIKKSDKIKTMLLALHVAFTGAFALVLVLVVALN